MEQLERDNGAHATVERVTDAAGGTVIKLAGEIDISNAHVIGTRLEQFVSDGGGAVVIDLSELGFMDSAGIAMLLRTVAPVDSVTIRNPSAVVRRILECTGLTGVLPIEASVPPEA